MPDGWSTLPYRGVREVWFGGGEGWKIIPSLASCSRIENTCARLWTWKQHWWSNIGLEPSPVDPYSHIYQPPNDCDISYQWPQRRYPGCLPKIKTKAAEWFLTHNLCPSVDILLRQSLTDWSTPGMALGCPVQPPVFRPFSKSLISTKPWQI